MDQICNISTKKLKFINDLQSSLSLYLKIRAHYSLTFLLETKDYRGKEHEKTLLCFAPALSFKVDNEVITLNYAGDNPQKIAVQNRSDVLKTLDNFINHFKAEDVNNSFFNNGLFGYISYEAVQYFEDINFKRHPHPNHIPDMFYAAFHYVLVLDHFSDELTLHQHIYNNCKPSQDFDDILKILKRPAPSHYPFETQAKEMVNCTDAEFIDMVKQGKKHCQRGDVFQIVLSRCFSQKFQGDIFNVYRTLRSINPSPYLYFFDFENFKIFGSSPESHLTISQNKARLFPIAGTFKRSGDDTRDQKKAQHLLKDIKENAEHIMLVDLARNDLSAFAKDVTVEHFKDIQYYSYVIHLVSQIVGKIDSTDLLNLVARTFPAGTLSGAPKYRAMQLIDCYEPTPRSYYGGAVGVIGFDRSFNHCIMIRSFLAKNNILYYQAGAGILALSDPKSELQEVNNKLGALVEAIRRANQSSSLDF